MIHDELGRCFVPGADGPEAVDMVTPRDGLDAIEGDVAAGDLAAARLEAVRALHLWVMDEGPHPRAVAERLVVATRHYAPELLEGLSAGERVAATSRDFHAQRRALVRMLLAEPRARVRRVRGHHERIGEVLGAAFRREEHTLPDRPFLGGDVVALDRLDSAAGAGERAERRLAARLWLRRIWRGAGLAEAMKGIYALTRSFWPELVMNMTGEELAALFGQTRAAESARVHNLVNHPIERHCGRHTTLRFQKSTAACGKYAGAARGNTHRADSVRSAAA